MDWNEDVIVDNEDDDEDEDGNKKKDAAPVKLEKKYGSKTVSTVNLLDERLIPYDLVSHLILSTFRSSRIHPADHATFARIQIVRLLEKLCFEDPAYQPFSASILIFMPGM